MMRVTGGMQARGSDLATARERALQLLDLSVTRQAAVLAYNRVFLLVGVLFLVALPLVLVLQRRRPLDLNEPQVVVE
jgi:DHA2 family multidrug resistance protein